MNDIRLVLVLISAAALGFQVGLTRFFSLAQGHHLAFMAISLALLGFGASGTYLSLKQFKPADLQRTLTRGAALFAIFVPISYLAINYLPFDAYRIAWERIQLLWLILYYLALTVPFFFSGLVIGAALAAHPGRAGSIYAANLLGSGLGPPLTLLALATVGGPGTVFLCALLGWLAVRMGRWPTSGRLFELRFVLYTAITIVLLYLIFRPPPLFDVRLTPYKSLAQAKLYPESEIVFSQWNAFSRVDVLRSDGIRSAPGLSFAYPGELPPQLGLALDGDNLVPITNPSQTDFVPYMPLALAFELRPKAETLIIEPGGGLAALVALNAEQSARSVTLVQSNHTVSEALTHQFANFSGNLFNDPRVRVINDEPRSYLNRTEQRFDLIILPLTDSFRAVTAGAYTLNENYLYTVETIVEALEHLSPDGLLVVERWLQLPPSESLRLWATTIEALRRSPGVELSGSSSLQPAAHLLALRSLQTSLVIASRSPLSTQDIAKTRAFANRLQFDLVWLPDIQPSEPNRFSVVPEEAYYRTFTSLLVASDPATFFTEYPYAVAPAMDDHPFFFHFFKWQQTPEILQTLGKSWQPFGGSGYLVLVVLLTLVVILSAILILLPLKWLKGRDNGQPEEQKFREVSSDISQPSLDEMWQTRLRYLLYFALLGLGFLFVEVPLVQRFILYLGQPAYSFAIVLSALLVATGVGSGYLSGRLPLRMAMPLIALLTVAYPWVLPILFETTLKFSFAGRIAVTVLALFPLGMLLGIPFPRGLNLLGRQSVALVPWAWAVNGCASVISAVLAAMIALTWNFSTVLWTAAAAYFLAGLLLRE